MSAVVVHATVTQVLELVTDAEVGGSFCRGVCVLRYWVAHLWCNLIKGQNLPGISLR